MYCLIHDQVVLFSDFTGGFMMVKSRPMFEKYWLVALVFWLTLEIIFY